MYRNVSNLGTDSVIFLAFVVRESERKQLFKFDVASGSPLITPFIAITNRAAQSLTRAARGPISASDSLKDDATPPQK